MDGVAEVTSAGGVLAQLRTTRSALLKASKRASLTVARLPFEPLWRGPDGTVANVGQNLTRVGVRALMDFAVSVPTQEFRAVESLLDAASRIVMPPVVALQGVTIEQGSLGEVPGHWYRVRRERSNTTILYFHGGGYIGTTPMMYAAFVARLARRTSSDVFVAEYRLAPEFPFPAAMHDAVAVLKGALDSGTSASQLFIAGDSAGGGLATALLCATEMEDLPLVAGLILFSPEVDLRLDKPSIEENRALDILPAEIPAEAYLQGVDPGVRCVSVIEHDVGPWPPTLVSFGSDEIFRDSIRLLVERLRGADVDTVSLEEPGMFHVFPILVPWAEASQRAFDAIEDFVGSGLTKPGSPP